MGFTKTLPTKRIAAGMLFVDDDGRVLLVEPSYKSYWDLPGGIVEAGESPAAAAQREVKEELGISSRSAGSSSSTGSRRVTT